MANRSQRSDAIRRSIENLQGIGEPVRSLIIDDPDPEQIIEDIVSAFEGDPRNSGKLPKAADVVSYYQLIRGI